MQSNQNDNGDKQPRDGTKFGEKYPDEVFLEAIEDATHASTAGVADRVGCDHATATRRLHALKERGDVECTDLGNNLLWTIKEQ